MFNTVDCQSFVLDYTTYTKDPQVTNDMMLEEVKQSLELLKKNADQWHIDTSRLYLCGFSAGGHLAALASNEYLHKLVENGVACEAHIYQKGKHGMSLASRASAKSPDEIDHHLVSWVQLTGEWIYQ